jgi:hypothetical protein
LEPESIGSPLATDTVDPASVIAASTVIAIFVMILTLQADRSSIHRIGVLRVRPNVTRVSFGLWWIFTTRPPRAASYRFCGGRQTENGGRSATENQPPISWGNQINKSVGPQPRVTSQNPLCIGYALTYAMVITKRDKTRDRLRIIERLTISLSDAGLRRRQTKGVYPNHRSSPWLAEVAARDRFNCLIELLLDEQYGINVPSRACVVIQHWLSSDKHKAALQKAKLSVTRF